MLLLIGVDVPDTGSIMGYTFAGGGLYMDRGGRTWLHLYYSSFISEFIIGSARDSSST